MLYDKRASSLKDKIIRKSEQKEAKSQPKVEEKDNKKSKSKKYEKPKK